MKVAINCNWVKTPKTNVYDDGHLVAVNEDILDPDYIVDFYPIIFSPSASHVAPEKRALAFGEPSPFFNYKNGFAEKIDEFYKGGLLTWHEDLKKFHQYKPYVFGMSWVLGYPVPDKTFGISGIFSAKSDPIFEGYKIRRSIEAAEQEYKIPTIVYSPKKSWLGMPFDYPLESKYLAFDKMFHWAIENCQENNYFTEKLIDCFIMESVPIYWGDPKIESRFVPEGIITFDKNNFIEQANRLTPYDYEKRIPAIKENRKRAFKYIDVFENVLLSLLGREL